MTVLKSAADLFVGIMLPLVILGMGLWFTKYLGGFYLLRPKRALSVMLSREKTEKTSPLRALSVSLAGTLGVGNIVGVAVAIVLGGAGALFWMWLSALLSMVLKYAEIVLSLRYRLHEKDGVRGGPMYYMQNGIGGKLGRFLAVIFSALGLFSAFSMGNLVQMNAAAEAIGSTYAFPRPLFGILAALAVGFLLTRGFHAISRVTAILIPIASLVYFAMAARILVLEWQTLPRIFAEIFSGAFDFSAASGGILGFLLSGALRQGVAKGCFSHEAGAGTAPMAHAGADTKNPAKQGLFGIFEVFFDTIVLCTLTGLVILLVSDDGFFTDNGMHLVIFSFARYYGRLAAYFVSGMIVLFALATAICWGYYGKVCLRYFTESARLARAYDILYAGVTVVAALLSERAVWELSDVTLALMTVLNLFAVFLLRRDVKKETIAAGLCR